MSARSFQLAGVLAGTVLAAACGGSAPPPSPAAQTKAAVAKPPAPPEAAAPAAPTYVYNPIGKRDPFRSPEAEPAAQASLANTACTEPLCRFDVDQLTLVAVVSGDANPVAMVEDPQKVGYVVHRNSRVGKQGGKVTQIQRDCVVVTEYFQTPDGKVNPNKVNLCIKSDKRTAPVLDLLQNKLYETTQ